MDFDDGMLRILVEYRPWCVGTLPMIYEVYGPATVDYLREIEEVIGKNTQIFEDGPGDYKLRVRDLGPSWGPNDLERFEFVQLGFEAVDEIAASMLQKRDGKTS